METISPKELKDRLSDDDHDELLVDVREPNEFKSAHIPEAENIPVEEVQEAIDKLKHIGTVYVQCGSGVRSAQVCQVLTNAGVHAINIGGGLTEWEHDGFTVIHTGKQIISIIRQVMISAGLLILIGAFLGTFVNEWWYALSAFVGAGLLFAGVTGMCGMAYLLGLMPWNRS